MEAVTFSTIGVVVNLLLGGVVWFMKQAYNDLKVQVRDHKQELDKVKEVYFKKEDFRDFKDELWTRLDKMEVNWATKIHELRK